MKDRPFHLPIEMLLWIFESIQTTIVDGTTHTRESALASCALVCKLWNEVATECLWRELPSALCLLRLLGEMKYEGSGGWRYISTINNPNADRFRHLANLVLRLNHRNASRWKLVESSRINLHAIEEAFQWFTFQTGADTLLPRVRTICWDAGDIYLSSQLPYFISGGLQRLSFSRTSGWTPGSGEDLECGIDVFKSLIRKRCQLIQISFHFAWKLSGFRSLQAAFSEFASTQTQLRSVKLRDWINEALLASVAGIRDTLVSFSCSVNRGVGITFDRMMDVLSVGFSVLQELDVNVTGEGMTDENFKQLLQVRSLHRVTLRVVGFPRITEADVEAVSRAWPDLEKFTVKLRWYPPRALQPLSILSPFAEWMGSTIQILELDLDAAGEPPMRTADSCKFVKLRELRIGKLSPAPYDPEDGVAEYLRSFSLGARSVFKLVIPNSTPKTGNASPSSLKGWQRVRYLVERGDVAAEEAHGS